MPPGSDSSFAAQLQLAAAGDADASTSLLKNIHEQLRAVAARLMQTERAGHTLSATALVHEAYVRLVGADELAQPSRAQFYFMASQAMRRILIEHARARGRQKRGGDGHRVPISLVDLAESGDPTEILALEEALCRLQDEDARAAHIVELRFYAGLSVDETAACLDVSPRTVDREWKYARAWLFQVLGRDGSE